MQSQYVKKISSKVIVNVAMLVVIGIVIVVLTQFPRDFNLHPVDGKLVSNTSFTQVKDNVVRYLNLLRNGEAFSMTVTGRGLSVNDILKPSFKRSFTLFFFALILALIIGIPKGIIDSRRNNKQATFKLLQTLIPLSIPDVLMISLVQFFGWYLIKNNIKFLGIGYIMYTGHDYHWSQAVYPVIALSLVPAAYIARITATSIENVYGKEYILAARGKGCSEFRIIMVHTMKNALADIIAAFPSIVSIMFSSLLIVERVFYYPGITYEMIRFYSSSPRDPMAIYTSMVAFTSFALVLAISYYILFIFTNLLKQVLLPQLKGE